MYDRHMNIYTDVTDEINNASHFIPVISYITIIILEESDSFSYA